MTYSHRVFQKSVSCVNWNNSKNTQHKMLGVSMVGKSKSDDVFALGVKAKELRVINFAFPIPMEK